MLKVLKFLLLVLVALIGAAFAYINPGLVTVSYYLGELQLPLGLLIFVLLGIGMLAGAVASLTWFVRLKRENRTLRRRFALAHQEIDNLRAMPLRDR